jgi:hypothetical protein
MRTPTRAATPGVKERRRCELVDPASLPTGIPSPPRYQHAALGATKTHIMAWLDECSSGGCAAPANAPIRAVRAGGGETAMSLESKRMAGADMAQATVASNVAGRSDQLRGLLAGKPPDLSTPLEISAVGCTGPLVPPPASDKVARQPPAALQCGHRLDCGSIARRGAAHSSPRSVRTLPLRSLTRGRSDSQHACANARRTSRDVLLVPLSFALGTLAMGIAAGTSSAQVALANMRARDAACATTGAAVNATSALAVAGQQVDTATTAIGLAQTGTLPPSVEQPEGSENQRSLAEPLGPQDTSMSSTAIERLSQELIASAEDGTISRNEVTGAFAEAGTGFVHKHDAPKHDALFVGTSRHSRKGPIDDVACDFEAREILDDLLTCVCLSSSASLTEADMMPLSGGGMLTCSDMAMPRAPLIHTSAQSRGASINGACSAEMVALTGDHRAEPSIAALQVRARS